ncbi:MAG: NADH-quinone oxidoreductase subunit L, partial [Fimbriimonadaceae bacterium]
ALAVAPVAIGFVIGAAITYTLAQMEPSSRMLVLTLFDWINFDSLRVPFEVRIDPLSMTMVLIVTGIGALIHLYATGYMAEDRDYTRFFTYMNLFIAAMLVLVLGNNLLMMFIGWEGVGLCSYLLIGFWYQGIENAKAANKAFIVNRIGDWGLTLGMLMLVALLAGTIGQGMWPDNRWLSYDVILPNIARILADQPVVATAIALLLFVGAMGKSAQFPLYVWLPDAMAGPTPVSALIHAATMVTAGVFMLNRLHVVFEMSPVGMAIIAGIGAFTAIFAALVAFGQTDIKKILAYSTVSQLGFMFVACGVGAFWAGMFHVVTHAFFKALLFLGSGAVIYAMAHNQDIRNYGNLAKYLKITSFTMIIGYLAIAGFPYMSGFMSKEAIIAGALGNRAAVVGGVNVGVATGWILLVVAMLTAAYMTRMTVLTFYSREERWRLIPAHAGGGHGPDGHAGGPVHGEEQPAHESHESHAHHGEDVHGFFYTDEEMAARQAAEHDDDHHHHELDARHEPKEVPPSMWVPLAVLAVFSVFAGLLYFGDTFKNWLYPAGLTVLSKDVVPGYPEGWVHQYLLAMSIAAGALGVLYGLVVYGRGLPKKEADEKTWHPLRTLFGQQFGYDSLLTRASLEGGDQVAKAAWRGLDSGVIDGFINGLAWMTGEFGRLFKVVQTGYARAYALVMLVGTVAILAYFLIVVRSVGGGP